MAPRYKWQVDNGGTVTQYRTLYELCLAHGISRSAVWAALKDPDMNRKRHSNVNVSRISVPVLTEAPKARAVVAAT